MKHVDVVVVGSGAAGLVAASAAVAENLEVVVFTKGQVGRSGATVTVSGDISVDSATCRTLLRLDGDPDDSVETFFEDTIAGGKFLNDQVLAAQMVEEVGQEVRQLLDEGLRVTGLTHAPGHRHPRGVWGSGMQMLQILSSRASKRGVRFREEFYVTDVLTTDGVVSGIVGIDQRTGRLATIAAKSVVLACGGGMMVYPFQTAPEELIGDGYWMALRAGAELIDMEMMQFLPCCLAEPPIWRGIQFPWLIGPQSGTRAWLLNKHGERFMERYDKERMEMSTRDIISIACAREVLDGRGGPNGSVYMSWAHLPHNVLDYLAEWYGKPHLRSNWFWEGFDFRPLIEKIKQGYACEVVPASHFSMGGISVKQSNQTKTHGLFACGEVAGGVHGANRLSGNACSQFLVQGRRAGQAAAAHAQEESFRELSKADVADAVRNIMEPLDREDGIPPFEFKAKLHDVASRQVGVLRSGDDLEQALETIRDLRMKELPRVFSRAKEHRYNKEWVEALECRSAALSLECMALSGLRREESRGAHFREDFPDSDDERFLHNGLIGLVGESLTYTTRPPALHQLTTSS